MVMDVVRFTHKQQRFCQEYLIDLNATQAAIRAGYNKRTARAIGSENLTKPHIQAEIQRLMDERARQTEITAEDVIRELAKIGFSKITDFIEFGDIETMIEKAGSRKKQKQVLKMKSSDEIDGSVVAEVRQTANGLTFKLYDKAKALELLGRHLGMFKDVHEHRGDKDNPIEVVSIYIPDNKRK